MAITDRNRALALLVLLRNRAQASVPTRQTHRLIAVVAAEHHRPHRAWREAEYAERAALSELDLQAARRGKSCESGERPKWREAQGKLV